MSQTTPRTHPQWAHGAYRLDHGTDIVGYFRRFESAWKWRNYLQTLHPYATFRIYEHGALVNVAGPAWNTEEEL